MSNYFPKNFAICMLSEQKTLLKMAPTLIKIITEPHCLITNIICCFMLQTKGLFLVCIPVAYIDVMYNVKIEERSKIS